MKPVHLVLVWHMHQPQYRDPASGRYFLPWTRLHALKDYWGMVKVLEEFPAVHVTFNIVPSLAAQLEEYASGRFNEPWFQTALAPADSLSGEQRQEILERAFQLNHENLMGRWPRFVELYESARDAGAGTAAAQLTARDWRDLQVLSQLAWMDEEYLARDPIVSALARKGKDFTEAEKQELRVKQLELLARVLPEYRLAANRGQIEISTTPFYHPILPLLCNTDVARVSNPHTTLPIPPFRYPEDAREQLVRARQYHEKLFGRLPEGVWPSEGAVSEETIALAAELGFRWFASDEGVLGRTLGVGFWRDPLGFPENAARLYTAWSVPGADREITGIFRDRYLSDLIGFVYSRMDASAAAEDLHRRIRGVGERGVTDGPALVAIILDGENAWEFYPGNGREFLRQFYRRIEKDSDIRATTVSEAIHEAAATPRLNAVFPGSWINANFDVWIGHAEDVRAWELLRDAREAYGEAERRQASNDGRSPSIEQMARAREALLAAEGSDWCWWYGPEHATANDLEYDELYRKHLTQVYLALGREAPEILAEPIRRKLERVRHTPPSAYLQVCVDGRETTYFEWLGAGIYSVERQGGAMHQRVQFLGDILYGFSAEKLFLRLDPLPGSLAQLQNCELRMTLWDVGELRINLRMCRGTLEGFTLERKGTCLLRPEESVSTALGKILEMSVGRELFETQGRNSLLLHVALWHGGLPVDVLPVQGFLQIPLGEETFAWPTQ